MRETPSAGRKVVAIIQARMGSTRLPGKVMADVAGRPMIDRVLARARRAETLDAVWVATSESAENDELARHVDGLEVPVFRGDEDDVLSRYVGAARASEADVVVRLTADCPMIDPVVIDRVVARFHESQVDFVSNTLERTYPDGLDVEVFSRDVLLAADQAAAHPLQRLHVTPYMTGALGADAPHADLEIAQVTHPTDFSHLRWCVDEPDDLAFVCRVFAALDEPFGWMAVVALLTARPELLRINRLHGPHEGRERDVRRLAGNEAARVFAESDAFFERAGRVIPLASQTFSKSHRMHVKGAAPLFIARGRGCRVWDLDGNCYVDYILGLLPVVLGYCDPDVDAAIQDQLERGITFSLPSPLETELAERLVKLIPCAGMVLFGKNGADATTAAIRLARAYTGRDKVAICGYHGWHDWYIATTSRRLGVPKAVQNLSVTFPYNDADALADLLEAEPDAFAAVILEPIGTHLPEPGFLERLRELAERYGVLLIFDEIITGFRINLGGAQAEYGVVPDLATFGKAMANGMPISAIVGRRDVMEKMEEIFFSTTFGGETLSIAAAIATLEKLEREDAVARLKRRGAMLMREANALFDRHGFGGFARFTGADWWPRLTVTHPPVEVNLLNSLLRQEFTAGGLLLGASLNLCLAHDSEVIAGETLEIVNAALAKVREALDSPDPTAHLRGRPVQPVFSVQ